MKLIFIVLTLFIFNNIIQANPIDSLKKTQTINFQKTTISKDRFEFGLAFGVLRTYIEYIPHYKEFEDKGKGRFTYQWENTPTSGFSFTRILNKKWWLQTGFRFGRSKWSRNFLFESFYNKSGEYIKANGEVGYDLTLVSTGTTNTAEMNLNVSITNASSLDDNDLIVSALAIKKSINWFQIPLGLEYRFGKKRLNYMVKSGVSFNQITTTNHHVEGFIESHVSELLINEIEYSKSDAKRFLEGYLGAGLRYELKENIILHGNFNFRYSPAIQLYSAHVYTGFNFGVSYVI